MKNFILVDTSAKVFFNGQYLLQTGHGDVHSRMNISMEKTENKAKFHLA